MVRYRKVSLWDISMANFKSKQNSINQDLKSLGVKRRIPLTKVIHLCSSQPIFLAPNELNTVSKRRRFK